MMTFAKIASQQQTIELINLARKPEGLKKLAKAFIADVKAYHSAANISLIQSLMYTGLSVWYTGPAQYVAENN